MQTTTSAFVRVLFLFLPRMLLHKPTRGGLLPKRKLLDRFAAFTRGTRHPIQAERIGRRRTRGEATRVAVRSIPETARLLLERGSVARPLPSFPSAPPFERGRLPFTCFSTATHSRFDAQPFGVLLLRRLWLLPPSSARNCRCGLLDAQWLVFWDAGASQSRARRHVSAEKEDPESCSTSAFKTWTLLIDNRRLEIEADGLPLLHGAQLAVDLATERDNVSWAGAI